MINLNLTKTELELVSRSLKFYANCHPDDVREQLSFFTKMDWDDNDAKNRIVELRGVIKYAIRGEEYKK